MTILRGGMLRSTTTAAHAIAAAVTAIVIAGQWFRRTSLAAIQPRFSLFRGQRYLLNRAMRTVAFKQDRSRTPRQAGARRVSETKVALELIQRRGDPLDASQVFRRHPPFVVQCVASGTSVAGQTAKKPGASEFRNARARTRARVSKVSWEMGSQL